MQVDIVNRENEKVGSIDLPDEVFGAEVNEVLLWEQVKAQRASRRAGTHETKRRGDVSGGGAKPFKQKGTGRARQGSSRAPTHVGGGTVFGPHMRDYSYRLPRTARKAALRSALSLRVKESGLLVLDSCELSAPKTRDLASLLTKIGADNALVVDTDNTNLKLSSRNLPKAKYVPAFAVNVYDILKHEKLVLTKAAVEAVVSKASAQADAQAA